MKRLFSVAWLWLVWLGGNLVRFVWVIGGILYVVVLMGLIFDSDSLGSVLAAPLAAVVWTMWIGTVFVVMGIVPAGIYLLILAAVPLRRRSARVRRAAAMVLSPLSAVAFYGSFGSEYIDAWEELAWLVALALAYGALVRLPPNWTERRPLEAGAAIQCATPRRGPASAPRRSGPA